MTKRRTAGSRSEAKNRDAFSKREERASLERLPVLNEKAYDFLDASPLMPEAMRRVSPCGTEFDIKSMTDRSNKNSPPKLGGVPVGGGGL